MDTVIGLLLAIGVLVLWLVLLAELRAWTVVLGRVASALEAIQKVLTRYERK